MSHAAEIAALTAEIEQLKARLSIKKRARRSLQMSDRRKAMGRRPSLPEMTKRQKSAYLRMRTKGVERAEAIAAAARV